ncbi:MAG: hypothetical protein MUO57_14950 [Anaerolineales bacterium]|nr:hypothetical protein [Anaerolineales bacterium]
MPDDLSKKISEVLNNKPIPPEDELSDALLTMIANEVAPEAYSRASRTTGARVHIGCLPLRPGMSG